MSKNYLGCEDIADGKMRVEIEGVTHGQNATMLKFTGIAKPLAVETAGELHEVYRAFGSDWTKWSGRRVTLTADPCAQYTAPIRISADIERAKIEPTPLHIVHTGGESPERLPGIKNQGWIGGAFNH